MAKRNTASNNLPGVWSAAPTPFTDKMNVDVVAVRRMIDHHLRLGVHGLFVAGTCGEGPWMTLAQRRKLVQSAADYARDKDMILAVQVTDNSAARVLDNMHMAKEDGAGMAVIAPPTHFLRPTPARLLDHYMGAIEKSPLPVAIYDQGANASISVPDGVMRQIVSLENVVAVKDSSADPKRLRILIGARRNNPHLALFTGYEFGCVEYLQAGYDGLLVGGGIFNGYIGRLMVQAVKEGNLAEAEKLQARMSRINYAIYGGKKLTCWLTGLKEFLVALGVFRTSKSHLKLPMTEQCRRAIKRVLEKDRDVLCPWEFE